MGKILLGDGVFKIAGVAVALTRGGSQFIDTRENRAIPADGDYGPVKGRIRKVSAVQTLVLNSLETLPNDLPKMYPGLSYATDTVTNTTTETIEGTEDTFYPQTDYNDISWTGDTLDVDNNVTGTCVITCTDAINLENIDWTAVDKDEVIQTATYTATYDPTTRKKPPFKVEYITTVTP